MKNVSTVIMCTGGIDSTTLLYLAAKEGRKPVPLTVDYGQAVFQKQLQMIELHTKRLCLPSVEVVEVKLANFQFHGRGLLDPSYRGPQAEDVRGDWDQLGFRETFIEGRNLIMVAYCLAFASRYKLDELWAGYLYDADEWQNYRSYQMVTSDTSPHFVDLLNVIALTGFSYQVRFRAPFYEQRLTKREVVELALSIGIAVKNETYSCHFAQPCGRCNGCLDRESYLKDKKGPTNGQE